jgi:hypothetical protein
MRHVLSRLPRSLAIAAFTLLSAAVASYAFSYLYLEHPHNAIAVRFAQAGLKVPAHLFGAGLALLLTPVQLSATVRRRAPRLHRVCGWLSAAGILVGGLGSIALVTHTQGGAVTGLAFATLATVWLFCMGNGIWHVVHHDIAAHRRWMMRTAALTFSAVTLRLTLAVGDVLHMAPMSTYIFAAWSCWPVNLAIAEVWLRWRHRRTAPLARVTARA